MGQLTFSTLMIPHRMAAGQLEKMEESFNYMELLALLEITNSERN